MPSFSGKIKYAVHILFLSWFGIYFQHKIKKNHEAGLLPLWKGTFKRSFTASPAAA